VALRYKVTHRSNVDYKNAPTLTWHGPDFSVVLRDNMATVELNGHYASASEARQVVDPFMRSWTVLAEVNGDPGVFSLDYVDAVIEDRSPPPPGGSIALQVRSASHTHMTGHLSLHVSHGHYPAVPEGFHVDAAVEAMHLHYRRYREDAEPLPMAAYFCLTAIEMEFGQGNRQRAAARLGVSQTVIQTFGRLASTATGPDARKYESHSTDLDSAGQTERNWLLAAMRLLIRRAGERLMVNEEELPKITMADLPSLPSGRSRAP
jgi:hypothetical protein